MTRSISLHAFFAVALSLTALPLRGGHAHAQEPPDGRPNVIVIVTDDQRVGTLADLPAIRRRFTRAGVAFPNGFATTPLCCPSRTSILTGRYAHNHGVLTGNEREAPVAAQELMITKELQGSGYATGLYGKYLNSWDLRESPSYLDDWAIFAKSAPDGYRHGQWNVNGTYRFVARYSTSYIRTKAIGFIERQEEEDDARPWFAYLAPAAPHSPYESETRYRKAEFQQWPGNPAVFEDERSDKPPWVQSREKPLWKVRQTRTQQLRTLLSVDDLVAEVFGTLRRLGEARDTLAIFISDNGFMWGEHGLGSKRFPYMPSVRIPFLMRWPRMVEAGTVDDRLVANIDVAPTIADAAGVSLTEPDGRSLMSTEPRDRLLLEFFQPKPQAPPTWASTITTDYQYIEYYGAAGSVEYREYYDLLDDPWQLENLYGDLDLTNDPMSGPQMSLQLQQDRSCAGDTCP